MLEGDSESFDLDMGDIEEEPTKRTRAAVPREAMRPPPVPREAREKTPAYGVPARGFVEEWRVLEELRAIKARLARVERGLWILGGAVVLSQKLDFAQLLEIAKALASSP